jgi:colicin import membrane protein
MQAVFFENWERENPLLDDTHYQTLGVDPSAPQSLIGPTFRRKSLTVHPDSVQRQAELFVPQTTADRARVVRELEKLLAPAMKERFESLRAAYEVLNDPELRAAYDAEQARPSMPTFEASASAGTDFDAQLNEFLRSGRNGTFYFSTQSHPSHHHPQRPQRPQQQRPQQQRPQQQRPPQQGQSPQHPHHRQQREAAQRAEAAAQRQREAAQRAEAAAQRQREAVQRAEAAAQRQREAAAQRQREAAARREQQQREAAANRELQQREAAANRELQQREVAARCAEAVEVATKRQTVIMATCIFCTALFTFAMNWMLR